MSIDPFTLGELLTIPVKYQIANVSKKLYLNGKRDIADGEFDILSI